jgi:hypothetical protein
MVVTVGCERRRKRGNFPPSACCSSLGSKFPHASELVTDPPVTAQEARSHLFPEYRQEGQLCAGGSAQERRNTGGGGQMDLEKCTKAVIDSTVHGNSLTGVCDRACLQGPQLWGENTSTRKRQGK